MDVLSALLAAPRAREAFVLRSDLQAPWAVRVEDRAPLTIVVVVRGAALLQVDGQDAIELAAGDSALVRGPHCYTLSDAVATAAQAVIGPGQTCSKPDGSPLTEFRNLGLLGWGNVGDGERPDTVLLTGTYQSEHQVSQRVLGELPTVIRVPAGLAAPRLAAVLDLLLSETMNRDVAQDAVVDRLVDLALVTLLRSRFSDPAHRPAWYAAQHDPVVGEALRRIHHEPHRRWTLASLAADVGVSRATLARQFPVVVGEPPISYLTRWRLDLATDLLRTTDLTLGAIASRVGYASGLSLSNAFVHARGQSPSAVRQGALELGAG